MLKITHPVPGQPRPKPTKSTKSIDSTESTNPGAKPIHSAEELMKIKERIEKEMQEQKQHERQAMADMFLAGPLAWPDYPESEDLEWSEEDYEEWVPLDCDSQESQRRVDSSDGQ